MTGGVGAFGRLVGRARWALWTAGPRRCYGREEAALVEQRLIGNREVVGHGFNSMPVYIDDAGFPFPAIRYRECTPELMAIREKERGDWRNLSAAEKKCLYRASFRQTFAEMHAASSEWKAVLGGLLVCVSLACWLHLFIHHKVYSVAPESLSKESRIAQYYRQVETNNQPFSGNYRPPGAELRFHPKNKEMLDRMEFKREGSADSSPTKRQ